APRPLRGPCAARRSRRQASSPPNRSLKESGMTAWDSPGGRGEGMGREKRVTLRIFRRDYVPGTVLTSDPFFAHIFGVPYSSHMANGQKVRRCQTGGPSLFPPLAWGVWPRRTRRAGPFARVAPVRSAREG